MACTVELGITICDLSFGLLAPFVEKWIPAPWANIVSGVVTLIALFPFLRTMAIKHNHSDAFQALWKAAQTERPLVATVMLRNAPALGFGPAVPILLLALLALSSIYHWHLLIMTQMDTFV